MRTAPKFMLTLLALSISTACAAEPISASGSPVYVTDSNGFVVRSSLGECWHSSSWTPAQATVVGCDGVLAKAVPVPAPAPSPQPAPAAPQPPEAAGPAVIAPPVAAAVQPRSEKVTLDTDAYFDFDKATLKPEGQRKLQELAQRLSSMNLEVVVATGHTDWTGSDAYNQKLSERRAVAVKDFLVQQGVARDRFFTEGKGKKQPIASNHTREGRAKNRRVVVELVGTRER
jgi:OOP family OmpA-OmpF porin